MLMLTKNISLEEMTASDTAKKLGIVNQPDEMQLQNMKVLAEKVLQPVRDHFASPIIIGPQHSGFRCLELNKAVGGVSSGKNVSQHTKGEAADFHVRDISLREVYLYIKNNLEFDQLIYEFGRWIHVSYRTGRNRKQALVSVKVNGKTQYLDFVDEDQLRI